MQIPRSSISSRSFSDTVQDLPGTWQRAQPRSRLIFGILAILALVAIVWFVVGHMGGAKPKQAPPPPVLVGQVRSQTVIINEQSVGTIVANATVQLTAQVQGRLMSAEFQEGQIVHKGDILFRIDPRPFQAAVQQAVGALNRDRASFVSAQNDKVRFDTLAKQGAASAQQRDQAAATANALAATIQSDQAAVAAAQLNLDYTVIRSPIDGKTGPILVQPGNIVTTAGNIASTTATDATSTGATPLVTITQIQPVKVSFFLPQSDLPRIQQRMAQNKMTVTIHVQGQGGEVLTAPVDFVGNAVSNQTGTIELRATFPNLDDALVPGQLTDVSVSLGQIDNAMTVAHDAINLGPDSSYVWVVDKNSKAQMVKVTVLYDDGARAAIQGKVKPGDRVITDGALRVVPGTAVSVKKGHAKNKSQAAAGAQ
ncbi:MAG TPA: efflux RND transporter periplasmic adaptor subunit [Rhizomicrobium sp.]|jgi:multidrug efflux system membrane fusion protein